jgi:hypothetical protein
MDRITPEVIEALTRLLDYTEPDERSDYEAATERHVSPNHIYFDICFLRGWLKSILKQREPRPIRGSRNKEKEL